ncbi:MAG: pyridoxal-phosphate dependent enzyme [Duganella sp.]
MTFPYQADPVRGAAWAELFARKMPALPFRVWPDVGDPREVRYLAAWQPPGDLATRFPNLEVLFSTGAGTDHFDFSAIPEALPVVRMVESGIIDGMVDYVTLAVLSIHRDWLAYGDQQRAADWRPHRVYPASTRRVGGWAVRVIGAEPALTPKYFHSRLNKERTSLPLRNTIADGLRISVPGQNPYPIIEKYVDEIVLVDDEHIIAGMRSLAKDAKLIAEPAAAIGIGALLAGAIKLKPDEKVCVVLSDGNWDLCDLAEVWSGAD